jgi:hypothetical protein
LADQTIVFGLVFVLLHDGSTDGKPEEYNNAEYVVDYYKFSYMLYSLNALFLLYLLLLNASFYDFSVLSYKALKIFGFPSVFPAGSIKREQLV